MTLRNVNYNFVLGDSVSDGVGVIAHYGEHMGEREEYSREDRDGKREERKERDHPRMHYITGTRGGSQTPRIRFSFSLHMRYVIRAVS